MRPVALLPLALVLAASCRTAGDPPSQAATPGAATTTVPPAAVGAKLSQPPPSTGCSAPHQVPSARIVLQRTACYGYCPDYTIEVRGDGQTLYEGRTFVRVSGKKFGRIPPAAADALFAKAACAHAETWKAEYTWPVTDNPTAIVTVDRGDGSPPIVVRDYPPCHETHDGNETPADLCDLEGAIDATFGSCAYVECPGPDGGLTYCAP